MSDANPIISVRGLAKAYGGHRVIHDVDLDVRRDETMVILGSSGGGKSTLLRCLVGLERPDDGTVCIDGIDVVAANRRTLATLRQRIGMAFQDGALFGSMTLTQNIDLVLAEFTRLPPTTRRIIARIKLAMVGLEDALDRFPSQLSGGMRKRAGLARAMAMDPEILFFDEPSAGLDPLSAASLDQLLMQLKKVFNVTLVVVTHELTSAFMMADRIALMHDGGVLVAGRPDELRASEDPIVRQFLDRLPAAEANGSAIYRELFANRSGPMRVEEASHE